MGTKKIKNIIGIFWVYLMIVSISLSLTSCSKNTNTEVTSHAPYIDKTVLYYIGQYIQKHPQYRSLTILTDIEYNWRKGYKEENIVLIGPSLDRLFAKEKVYPSYTFLYKNKMIFVQSSADNLAKQDIDAQLYHQYSIHLKNHENGIISYLKSATIIKYGDKGGFVYLTDRADTIILKKEIKFIPPKL